MTIVLGALAVALVIAIAAVIVIREATRLGRQPPPAVFDRDDALEWVVEHLPDDAAATLTEADVRRILDLHADHLAGSDETVVGSGDEVAFILERAAATGEPYHALQVDAVLQTLLAYLRDIGAIGPRVTPPDGNGSGPPTA